MEKLDACKIMAGDYMNKNIKLEGIEEIYKLIDNSYKIALQK